MESVFQKLNAKQIQVKNSSLRELFSGLYDNVEFVSYNAPIVYENKTYFVKNLKKSTVLSNGIKLEPKGPTPEKIYENENYRILLNVPGIFPESIPTYKVAFTNLAEMTLVPNLSVLSHKSFLYNNASVGQGLWQLQGNVVALETDKLNYKCLTENLELLGLNIPVFETDLHSYLQTHSCPEVIISDESDDSLFVLHPELEVLVSNSDLKTNRYKLLYKNFYFIYKNAPKEIIKFDNWFCDNTFIGELPMIKSKFCTRVLIYTDKKLEGCYYSKDTDYIVKDIDFLGKNPYEVIFDLSKDFPSKIISRKNLYQFENSAVYSYTPIENFQFTVPDSLFYFKTKKMEVNLITGVPIGEEEMYIKAVSFTDKPNNLEAELNKTKNLMNNLNLESFKRTFDSYANLKYEIRDKLVLTNGLYEIPNLIKCIPSVTNAWIKYFEMYSKLNLFINFRGTTEYSAFFNAELPGSSLVAFLTYWSETTKDKNGIRPLSWYGSSILSGLQDTYKIREYNKSHWLMGKNNDGDCTNLEVLKDFESKLKVDFYSHDAGINVDNDFNSQEELNSKIHLGCAMAGFMTMKIGAISIFKQYTAFLGVTQSLMKIYSELYESFFICKPLSSRPLNSEIYLIGVGFKGYSPKIRSLLEERLLNFNTNFIPGYETYIDLSILLKQQITSIKNLVELYKANPNSKPGYNLNKKLLENISTDLSEQTLTELKRKLFYEKGVEIISNKFGVSKKDLESILVRHIFNNLNQGPDPVFSAFNGDYSQMKRDILFGNYNPELIDSIKQYFGSRTFSFEGEITDKGMFQSAVVRYSYLNLGNIALANDYSSYDKNETEGFSNIFNKYFNNFYSAFPDVEKGSLGSFFDAKEYPGKVIHINPPFDETIIEKSIKAAIATVKPTQTLIFTVPVWKDMKCYELFKDFDKKIIPKNRTNFLYYSTLGLGVTHKNIQPCDIYEFKMTF